jgi:GNAT superfamily N-acetyltransferase
MVRDNSGVVEEERDGCLISTDPARLDLDVIHGFLSQAYWCEDIPRPTLERAIRNSLCFGVYADGRQVGFARVITDRATFAYLADVFILESHRRRGLSKHIMEFIMAHPDLQGLRRWSLATRDAHCLYSEFGFTPLRTPERHMEIIDLEIYKKARQAAAANE